MKRGTAQEKLASDRFELAVLDRGGILVLAITLMTIAAPALAVEGALGRTLPGVWIQP